MGRLTCLGSKSFTERESLPGSLSLARMGRNVPAIRFWGEDWRSDHLRGNERGRHGWAYSRARTAEALGCRYPGCSSMSRSSSARAVQSGVDDLDEPGLMPVGVDPESGLRGARRPSGELSRGERGLCGRKAVVTLLGGCPSGAHGGRDGRSSSAGIALYRRGCERTRSASRRPLCVCGACFGIRGALGASVPAAHPRGWSALLAGVGAPGGVTRGGLAARDPRPGRASFFTSGIHTPRTRGILRFHGGGVTRCVRALLGGAFRTLLIACGQQGRSTCAASVAAAAFSA